jgi:hypothetical protein
MVGHGHPVGMQPDQVAGQLFVWQAPAVGAQVSGCSDGQTPMVGQAATWVGGGQKKPVGGDGAAAAGGMAAAWAGGRQP